MEYPPIPLAGHAAEIIQYATFLARRNGFDIKLSNSPIFSPLCVSRTFPANIRNLLKLPPEMQYALKRSVLYTNMAQPHEYELWKIFQYTNFQGATSITNDLRYDPCVEFYMNGGLFYPIKFINEAIGEAHKDITIKDGKIILCTELQKNTVEFCRIWLQDVEIQQKLDIHNKSKRYKIEELKDDGV